MAFKHYVPLIIDNISGKVYPVDDDIEVFVIKDGGFIISLDGICYGLSIKEGDLKFEKAVTNPNIDVVDIFIDKFDNVFFENNSIEEKTGKQVFIKEGTTRYNLSKDKTLICLDMFRELISYFDNEGRKKGMENNANFEFDYDYLRNEMIMIKNNLVYIYESDDFIVFRIDFSSEESDQTKTKVEELHSVSAENGRWDNNYFYFIDNNKNLKYINFDSYTQTNILQSNISDLYKNGLGEIIASENTASSLVDYKIVKDQSTELPELETYSGSPDNIIIIQPLN